jgi:hypothetical protein
MLEIRFLNPHLTMLNPATETFIGNAITVALTTWPLMPLAIWGFSAWLFPENRPRWLVKVMPLVLVLCYALEIPFCGISCSPEDMPAAGFIRRPLNQALSPHSFSVHARCGNLNTITEVCPTSTERILTGGGARSPAAPGCSDAADATTR